MTLLVGRININMENGGCAMGGTYGRTKSKPSFKHQFKWHAITILLTVIRFTNVFTCLKKALTKLWRTGGWWVGLNKPK
jgi:hypothetical protein